MGRPGARLQQGPAWEGVAKRQETGEKLGPTQIWTVAVARVKLDPPLWHIGLPCALARRHPLGQLEAKWMAWPQDTCPDVSPAPLSMVLPT